MPKPVEQNLTWCLNCRRAQPDPMKRRGTCDYCGCSPLPSLAYGEDAGVMYPHNPRKAYRDAVLKLAAEVERRKAEREKDKP
jgi:hypothetical protein